MEAARAEEEGADYLFLSPVFPPRSKTTAGPTLGVAGFAAVAAKANLPVYALGGVTPESLGALREAGAAGAAVCGDLFLADDVRNNFV